MTEHKNTFPQVGASLAGTPRVDTSQGEPGATSGITGGELAGDTGGGGATHDPDDTGTSTDTEEGDGGGGAGAIMAVAAVAAVAYFLYK